LGLSDSVLITKWKQDCTEELGTYRKKFQIIGTVKTCITEKCIISIDLD